MAWSLLQPYRRDVAVGLQKEIRPKSPARTAVRWSLVNIATERACRRVGRERFLRLRYEDFVRDPEGALRRIGAMSGVDLAATAAALGRGDPVAAEHQMAGNRSRMKGARPLSQDAAWRLRMPAVQQQTVRRLGGWMLRRYGYLPDPARSDAEA